MKKLYKHVLWDWNGTLLNDVEMVVEVTNKLLVRRNLPLMDISTYRKVFTFPVKNYYKAIGFDFNKEVFEEVALEFIQEFYNDKYTFELFPEAESVLENIGRLGITQSILSATKEDNLKLMVKELGIEGYFKGIMGLDNHWAKSKVERGKLCLKELNLHPNEVILIGDTIHDYEVASEIGCDCLIISNGHQTYERIKEVVDGNIVGSLLDVPQAMNLHN